MINIRMISRLNYHYTVHLIYNHYTIINILCYTVVVINITSSFYTMAYECNVHIYIYTYTIADTDSNVIRDRYFCHTYLYSL